VSYANRKCLAAHTAMSYPYPPYINASLDPDDGRITVIVRQEPNALGVCSDAQITMSQEDFKKFIGEAVSTLIAVEDRAAAAVAAREKP
jgi:hypothetical protein